MFVAPNKSLYTSSGRWPQFYIHSAGRCYLVVDSGFTIPSRFGSERYSDDSILILLSRENGSAIKKIKVSAWPRLVYHILADNNLVADLVSDDHDIRSAAKGLMELDSFAERWSGI